MKQKLTEMIERYGKVAIYLYLGIFAATLELSKEGAISVSQKKLFEKIMIKKI